MNEIELSAGPVEYTDTGGDGPIVVFLHGLMMDASLWDEVIGGLSAGHRCLAPTLPLGAHRRAMKPDADLSLPGIARLVAEFLDQLGLSDVTLVGNDTGGALVQLLIADGTPRVSRAVLVSCDAFDNFPPGLTGRTLVAAGKLPPGMFGLFMQQLRIRPVRRLPIAFGWLTKRGDAATARWIRPVLSQPAIRRDTVRVLRAIAADKRLLVRTAESLPSFDHPALVVWARRDRVMPPEHGTRLAELLPHASLAEIDDSYTLIPLDQPAELTEHLRKFLGTPLQPMNGTLQPEEWVRRDNHWFRCPPPRTDAGTGGPEGADGAEGVSQTKQLAVKSPLQLGDRVVVGGGVADQAVG